MAGQTLGQTFGRSRVAARRVISLPVCATFAVVTYLHRGGHLGRESARQWRLVRDHAPARLLHGGADCRHVPRQNAHQVDHLKEGEKGENGGIN